MDAKLRNKIKALQWQTRKRVNSTVKGGYRSTFKGQGLEFVESRQYIPGDDVRRIDWKLTARAGEPFVKEFHEDRDLTIFLIADRSSSLNYGSGTDSKAEMLAQLGAALSYLAVLNHDRIGLIGFSEGVDTYLPAKKGRAHSYRLIAKLLEPIPAGQGTDLAAALKFFQSVQHRRAIVFVLSDFHALDYERQLKAIANRHELVTICARDPHEEQLDYDGYLRLEDLEAGPHDRDQLLRRSSRPEVVESAAAPTASFDLTIGTDGAWLDGFIAFLYHRFRR